MHRIRLIIGLGALSVVPIACTESPAQPHTALGVSPLANVSWNPDNGNPRIIRGLDNTGFLVIDPTTDMFSIQSWGDGQFGCNGTPTLYSYEDFQVVLRDPNDPAGAQFHVLELGHGIYIAVFQGWSGWLASGMDCGNLPARKVAEGSGNLRFTDNDYFAPFHDSHNSDAYGFVANGRLSLVGGGTANYTGTSRCVWDGDTGARARCTDRIQLQ
jgi:hypothetical protein